MNTNGITRLGGFSFTIIVAAIIVNGCDTYPPRPKDYDNFKFYVGPVLPRDQVAHLDIRKIGLVRLHDDDHNFAGDTFQACAGSAFPLDSIWLLPGRYTITFQPKMLGLFGGPPPGHITFRAGLITKHINVEAGKTYKATWDSSQEQWWVVITEEK